MPISKTMRFFIAMLVLAALSPLPARAQTVIRDTEVEEYMAEWFAPIYKAAGMSPDQVKIIIVQDSQINAFVAGGSNIFFYTGLLQKTSNPGEVIGVMAAIASGDSGAAATVGAASSSMAQRGFLKHTRTFESSADQAALRYFEAAHLNPTGFETFLKKLEGQELLPSSQQSEYVRSHPLTRSRVDTVGARVDQSPDKDKKWPDKWAKQHKMMIAKLAGFISPQQVVWTYDDRDNSAEALTARAVAAYRMNEVDKALKLSDQLLALEPDNPYFLELKGQMLMDFGRVAQAIPFYEKAVKNKPDAGLIRISLAHAQIETAGNNAKKLQKAIDNLKIAQKSEPRTPRVHRLLATAYGRSGDETRAKLHLAEEALLQGKYDYAKGQATAASKNLKQGTSDWLRANDIINYVQTHKDEDADS
jgi:predicted Zn-dependent protease